MNHLPWLRHLDLWPDWVSVLLLTFVLGFIGGFLYEMRRDP